MPYRNDMDVGLLLGINCVSAMKPREVIPGNDNDPFAKRTALGWGVIGIVKPIDCRVEVEQDCAGANRIIGCEVHCSSGKLCHFTIKTHTKEVLNPL